ncbi:MAG: putative bifunctional diguanylate cyclase/phosphodiesterase [Nitriliruptoraceae bacterium]
MEPRTWTLTALAGTAAGLGFLLSESDLVRETLWRLVLLGSLLLVVRAARAGPPGRRHPWWVLAGALGLFLVANALDYVLWATPALSVWSDPITIVAFPLVGAGALALTRAKVPGGDRESAIDGAIVMFAMASVLSGTAYHPELLADGTLIAQRLLHTTVAPLVMSAVTAATLRLLFIGGTRLPAAWMVVGAALTSLLGNIARALLVSSGLYERGTPSDVLILASYLLIGLAAAHPSAVELTTPTPHRLRRFTTARVLVLGIALLAAPVTVLARGVATPFVPTLIGSVLVSLLVLWRISRLVLDRERARGLLQRRAELQEVLAALGRQAMDGASIASLTAATTTLMERHLGASRCEVTADPPPADEAVAVVPVATDGRALVVSRDREVTEVERSFIDAVAHLLTLAIERQVVQERLELAATHDVLTGLPNRRLLLDRIAQALLRRSRQGDPVCVLFVDLDGFKRVNDDRGHQVGDQVLLGVADRLRTIVRQTDTVARLASDEFVLVCEVRDAEGAQQLAQRVSTALSQPYLVTDRPVRVGVSIGFTLPDRDRRDPEQVLMEAVTAMYEAKSELGPAVARYDEALAARHHQRREVEAELERAIAEDEFTLVYQPLWRLEDHGAIGAEALVRWDHPRRGRLGPDAFLPVAEQSELMLPLGDRILVQACTQLAIWQRELPPHQRWTLYVNLANRQLLAPNLVDRVAELLDEHGLRPDRLGFEISERAVVDDRVMATAAGLSALGTRLAWDDFGTGYSSISHLRGWPLDVLKLDGSLILGAVDRAEDAGIVRAMCSVAHELGVEVLAEHVASVDELTTAQQLGCDLAQGFHLGRPVPAEELWVPRAPMAAVELTPPVGATAEELPRAAPRTARWS